MNFSKIVAIAALSSAGISGTAFAQAAGDTIYGPQGGVVGTIESVDGDNAVVNTGTVSTALPISSFAKEENGVSITWTKADLEAAVKAAQAQAAALQEAAAKAAAEEAAARLAAAIAVGATVQTVDPLPLGTIDTIDGENVIIVREDESLVTLPKDIFALDAEGIVTARVTMADLEAALAAQAG